VGAVLGDHEGRLRKFHLLERARRALQRSQTSAAVGAAVRAVVEGLVDLVRSEGRSLVAGVPRLAADVTLAAVLGRRLGRLDDVAEGGLELLEEFLERRATWADNSATFFSSSSMRACCFWMICR